MASVVLALRHGDNYPVVPLARIAAVLARTGPVDGLALQDRHETHRGFRTITAATTTLVPKAASPLANARQIGQRRSRQVRMGTAPHSTSDTTRV